ncbi:MAG: hypothetical protein J1F17_05380 [Oscillospiraceae bacterium]|nr:hypothetical protein [Oscillospiraceae bacterium]
MRTELSYVIGLLAGLILVVLLSVLFYIFRKNKQKKKYDERQKAIQGVAYKLGFFTLLGYFLINGCICEILKKSWGSPMEMNFIGVCLSLVVFVGYSVIKDAYVSINQKEKSYIISFAVVAILNIFCYFINSSVSAEITNIYNMNLICGITFALLTVIVIVKNIVDRIKSKKEYEV